MFCPLEVVNSNHLIPSSKCEIRLKQKAGAHHCFEPLSNQNTSNYRQWLLFKKKGEEKEEKETVC